MDRYQLILIYQYLNYYLNLIIDNELIMIEYFKYIHHLLDINQ